MLELNPAATIADRLISRFTKYDKDNAHLKEMTERVKKTDLSDISKINLLTLGQGGNPLKRADILAMGACLEKLWQNLPSRSKIFQTVPLHR